MSPFDDLETFYDYHGSVSVILNLLSIYFVLRVKTGSLEYRVISLGIQGFIAWTIGTLIAAYVSAVLSRYVFIVPDHGIEKALFRRVSPRAIYVGLYIAWGVGSMVVYTPLYASNEEAHLYAKERFPQFNFTGQPLVMIGTNTPLFRTLMLTFLILAFAGYGSLCVTMLCRVIYLLFQRPPETMSVRTAAMHRRLTIVVLLQYALFIVAVLGPIVFIIVFTFLGIEDHRYYNWCLSIMTIHSNLNCILLFTVIKAYRRRIVNRLTAAFRIFRHSLPQNEVHVSSSTHVLEVRRHVAPRNSLVESQRRQTLYD